MPLFQVVNIDWETDGESVDLPDNLIATLPDGLTNEEVEDRLSDHLSDKYGWLHNGFQFWELKPEGQCKYCNAKLTRDRTVWLDETGSDVCGVDGDNAPHVAISNAESCTLNIEEVLDHYIGAALWSTNDESDPETGGEPMDRNYDRDDIDANTIENMRRDVTKFCEGNHHALSTWDSGRGEGTNVEQQTGHDFWLNRNGHGCGFWESEWKGVGDQLSEVAKAFGETHLYVGDDGIIYD